MAKVKINVKLKDSSVDIVSPVFVVHDDFRDIYLVKVFVWDSWRIDCVLCCHYLFSSCSHIPFYSSNDRRKYNGNYLPLLIL